MGGVGRKSDSRFRSFAERYLVTRASTFRAGYEVEDGWKCVMDAKRIYKIIQQAGEFLDDEDSLY